MTDSLSCESTLLVLRSAPRWAPFVTYDAAVVVGSLLLLAAPVTTGPVDQHSETNLDAGVVPVGKKGGDCFWLPPVDIDPGSLMTWQRADYLKGLSLPKKIDPGSLARKPLEPSGPRGLILS